MSGYNPPVTVISPEWDIDLLSYKKRLIDNLIWERHDTDKDKDRLECFIKSKDVANRPYLYNKNRGERPYYPQPITKELMDIWARVEAYTNSEYEVVFINCYLNGNAGMGWHFDNSPSIDQSRRLAVLIIGDHHRTSFRSYVNQELVKEFTPVSGQILIMEPNCNQLHQHMVSTIQSSEKRLSFVFRPIK